jgi:hypothetical protein
MPNLYPVPGVSQNVDIFFNNAGLADNSKYALSYTIIHNGVELSDVNIDEHINTANSYITIPFYPNNSSFSGQFLSSGTGTFPTGTFEAGLNMNQLQYNFLYGKYLKTNYVRIRMTLAWRSDRTYDDDEYTLVVSLIQMSGGNNVNKKYNSSIVIGGNGATPGETILSDTITTIRTVTETIYDTICYSQIPYLLGRTTITTDTINKAGYKQPDGADFYSIIEQQVTFGKPVTGCNERIDSIATVRLYVYPELTLAKAGTGHNLTICSYANAGYVSVTPAGGKAPYTVFAYKQTGVDTYETSATGSVVIGNSNPTDTIKGLEVGTYKLVCVDAAGCEARAAADAVIVAVPQDNVYTISADKTDVFCNGGETGALDITVTRTAGEGAEPITYSWAGPDSYTSNVADITNLKAGDYTVTITDVMGCTKSETFHLAEGELISTSASVACCASELPYRYADTVFTAAGTKQVHYNSAHGCDSVVNVTLVVRENPTVDWGSTPDTLCTDATLSATVNDGMSNYTWTKDGVATADNGNTADFTWAASGAKTISVNFTETITDNGLTTNCRVVSDTVLNIDVRPLPNTEVTTKVGDADETSTLDITACAGQTVSLAAADGFEYVWMKVGPADGLGTNRILTFENISSNEAGKYYTILTNSTTGCTIYSDTVTITVNTPSVSLNDGTPEDICLGNSQTLTAMPTHSNDGTLYYKWNTDETTASIVVTPTSIGAKEYTVTVTDSIGNCSAKATATFAFTVKDTVRLTFHEGTNANPTICLGNSIEDIVIDSANCAPMTISPALPAGLTFANGKISGTPTVATTYNYTINAASNNGCASSDKTITGTITVNDTVKLAFHEGTNQNPSICLGNPIDDIVIDSANCNPLTISPALPAGLTFANGKISGTPTEATTYNYTITATSNNDCSAYNKTITGTITVNDTVKLTVTGDTTFSICPKTAMTDATQFTVTNGTIAQTGTLPTGITFSAENAINGTPTEVGTFRYTITANSDKACSSKTMTGTITVYDTATLTVTGTTEQTFCLGGELSDISFVITNGEYDNSGTLPAGVTFGNNKISGTPTEAGEFTYTVKVKDANDCSDFDKEQIVKITVYDTVKLTVSGDTTQTKCLGGALANITFTVTNGTGNLAWTATPAGVTSDAAGISGTPTAAGTYKYTYTATSDHSCSSKTVTGTITVNDTVKLTVSGDTTFSICPGTAMTAATQFTVTNGTIAQTGTLPTGITFSAENAINGTPTEVGTFRYTITANSNNGCSAYDKIMTGTITVYDTATLTVTGTTEQTLCLGNKLSTINFAKTNGVYANTGTLPAGVTFAGDSISGTPTEYGEFTYTVKIVSANDCSAFDKTQIVKITVNDTVQLTVSGDTTQTKCLGEALADITFSVTNGNGALVWTSIPAGVTQSATGISGTPTAAGTYKYTYTATSNYNCNPKTVTGTITVNDTVVPTISANNENEICVSASETRDTITLSTNITETGYTFAWTLDGGTAVDNTELTSSTVKAQWATAGTKNIQVAITNSTSSCVSRATASIKVNDVIPFTVAHTAGLQSGEYRICAYDKDTLTPSVESGITYTWTPNNGYLTEYNSYKQIFSHNVSAKYTYTVNGLVTTTGCQTSQTVSIIVDSVPTVNVTAVDVTCFGYNNGSLTATVTGGTGNYCYKWSDNNTNVCSQPNTHSRGNLQGETLTPGAYPATYTVTVTDIHGCTVTGEATINEPIALTVTKTQHENVDCYSGNNGILAYSATGGTQTASGNYNFKFNSNDPESATAKIYSGLYASIDTIKVTDAKGCSVTLYDTIRQPEDSLQFIHYASKDVDCHGDANGKIQFTVSGGWNPGTYSYSWKKGDNDMSFNDTINSVLTAGTYTITATDDSLCPATLTVTINEPEVLVLTATDSADIKCFGDNNGVLKVNAEGGNGSYEYKWDDHDFAAGITEKNDLTPGLHTVVVKDAKGCKDTVQVTIETPDTKLAVSHDSINPSCFGLFDGKIVVTVTGGRTPYTTSWDNESGITATERTELPKGNYYFTVVDDSLCVAHDTIRLTEPEEFHVAISGITDNRDSLCASELANYTAFLTAAEAGYTYQYQWYKDDVVMTDSTNAQITNLSNPNGEYEYKVIVTQQTTSTPCTQKDSVVLTVLEVPNVTITALNDTICFGTEAKLTASGAQAYAWTLNGVDKGSATEIAIEQAAGTDEYFVHNYVLTGTNTYGTKNCAATDDTVVIINNPYVTLTPMADQTICASTTATLAASVATKANDRLGYTWKSSKLDGSGMEDIADRTSSITVEPADTTVYYLTVTDTVGECTKVAYDTVIVNVNNPAVTLAEITFDPNDTICLGESATLTASYTALKGEISYKWSAEGTNRADTTVTPGLGENTYTVTATATIGTCFVTASKTATVVVNDTVTLTQISGPKDTAICEGQSIPNIVFNATNSTLSIEWEGGNSHGLSFDDVNGAISGTPTATVTYTLKATSNNAPQCIEKTVTHTITVSDTADFTITAKYGEICANASDTLTVTDGYTYTWDVPTGLTMTDGANEYKKAFTGTPTTSTTYTVTVTAATGSGCQTTMTKDITVDSLPRPTITANAENICLSASEANNELVMYTQTNYNDYEWNLGTDGSAANYNGQEINAKWAETGEKTVTVTVKDEKGCYGTGTKNITVKDTTTFAFTSKDGDFEICIGNIDTLTATDGLTYTWPTASELTENGNNSRIFTSNTKGVYNYNVTGVNSDGCQLTKTVTVTVDTVPAITLTPSDVLCYGESTGKITTTVTGGNDFTYAWTNSANETVTDINALPVGRYYVTVTNDYGCTATANDTIKQPDTLTIEVSAITNIACSYSGNMGSISVEAHGGKTPTYTYKLNDGDFLEITPTWTDLNNGDYTITVKDENNCTASVDTVIKRPAVLAITHDSINPTCFGETNGEITAHVTGGNEGTLTYAWSNNGSTNETLSDLTAGKYTLQVNDVKGCVAHDTIILTQPEEFNIAISGEDSICAEGNTEFVATLGATGSNYTYQWYKGTTISDETKISGATSTTLSSVSEANTYYIVATQTNGTEFSSSTCTQNDTVKLTVLALPELVFSYDPDDTICLYTPAIISVTGADDYSWTDGLGSDLGSNDVVDVEPTVGIHAFEVTGTKIYGTKSCVATAKDTVVVLPLPSASLTVNGTAVTANDYDLTICEREVVTFSVPSQSGMTYTWKKDNAAIEGEEGNELVLASASSSNNGVYNVVVKNSTTGCDSTSYTVKLTVNERPDASITANHNNTTFTSGEAVCAEADVVLSIATTSSDYTYQWKKNGSALDGKTEASLTLSSIALSDAGEYTLYVKNTTTNCDTTTLPFILKVNALPVVTLSEDNELSVICADSAFHFTVTSDTVISTYNWTRNDISIEGTATLRATESGTYKVAVIDHNGCQATTNEMAVKVNALPVVSINEENGNTAICADSAFHFTLVSDTALVSYKWMRNGDSINNTAVIREAGLAAGSHTYTATVVDRNSCKVTTSGFAATVNALPIVTVNDEEICRNSSVVLEATGANTYEWTPADSLSGSTGASVTFSSRGQGTFNIIVTGTDLNNCSASDTATIKVNDLPGDGNLANLADKEFCKGGVSGFKVSGFSSYTWTCVPSDGSLSAEGDTATFTGNTAGNYVVKVEVTDANGCKSSTSANIIVDTLPVPTITVNADVCVNGDLEFTTEGDNVHDYVWNFDGEKVDSTGATLKLKWDAAGEKTVTVNYTDNNNCTAATATSKTITVHALPVVEITEGRETSICRGSSITLHTTMDTPEATDFLWDNNVGDDNEVTVTPVTDDSTFVVTGSYQPVDGLTCAITDTITVHLKDTVKLTVDIESQNKCLGQAIDDITVTYEAATLSWLPTTFTESLTATEGTNSVTISGNITHAGEYTYEVTATSTNNCELKKKTITITVSDTNKLSSASSLNQTICLGTDIEGIELDTANCTLTFSPELNTKGLTYNATNATINGTPSVAESFTVTITATPATDGCNAAKTLEFTINVLDTNKLEFADPATATQEICLGEPIADIVLDTANCTLDLTAVLAIEGLSYNAAFHKIEGTPANSGSHTVTITATATNQVNSDMPCNTVIIREITIKVNDTVKIAATEGDDLTRKLCKGTDITEVKLWATNGTIALGSGSIPTDLTSSYPTSANDTIKLNGTMTIAGTYNFYVVATGTACTSSKDSMLVSITVDTIPFVAITPDVDTVCPNADLRHATLTATAGYGTGYAWSCSTETANSITVTPENSQNIYTVTVTNGENCTATASDTIRLYTLSVSTISGDNEICLGESTTLTAAPDAEHTAASYEWIGIAGANTNEVTVSPVADSIFRVRVVDNNGCYDTAKITITVDTLPTATITASATTVCQDGTLELSADNAGSGLTYLWKDGADSVFNARVFNFVTDTNTTSGIHNLSVKITDGNGCANTGTKDVTVRLVPILSETHDSVRCYGESNAAIDLNVRYKELIVVDNTYSWTKEGDDSFTRNTEDITGLRKGTYNVTVSDGNCSAEMSVTIEQPDTLTLSFAHAVSQLCSGTDSLTVVPVGGNGSFNYVWTTDGTDGSETADSILRISNLSAGIHTYSVTVTDAEGCTAYTPEHEVISDRIEVAHEINLGPGETYVHEGYTYGLSPDDEGKTFEVLAGTLGTGNCDSVYIYTVHMYGIGMNFTNNTYTIRHSGYFNNYQFTPTVVFDTIQTSTDVDNEFYAFVTCNADSIDNKRIDMKYEIVFNDGAISDDNFSDYVENLRMMSYYDHDRNFYGIPHIDSARGEMPGTTFLYQYPSNSTAYYFDYFNFGAFRNMPQKIQFNFTQPGTYTIKFTVEERVESTGGQTWGFYNPYVVNGAYGPLWGGRGDTYTGKKTIASRNMTVIVGEAGSTPSTPIVTNIDNYANNTVPTVTTFPNPARDLLNLNISGMEGNTRITITDATGKLVRVYEENLLGNDATLTYDIATFSQGIYFINVYNNETILTNKFIVTK